LVFGRAPLALEIMTDEGILIEIRVHPRSKLAGIWRSEDGRIHLAVREPPEKGKANRAVVHSLADSLCVSASRVEIIAGLGSHNKRIRVRGLTPSDLDAWLRTLEGPVST
jgi:uncharacterized protein (TIGR00251 family)